MQKQYYSTKKKKQVISERLKILIQPKSNFLSSMQGCLIKCAYLYWNLGNSGLNDTSKHNVKINQQYIQKRDMVQVPLYIGPP